MTDEQLRRKLAKLTLEQQRQYSRMKLQALRTEAFYDPYAPSRDYQYAGVCDGVVVCYAKTLPAAVECAAERMSDNNEVTLLMAA